MRWDLRFLRSFASLALAVACSSLPLQAADELEQHLRDQFKSKTLLLRSFYEGDSLRYDASGQVSGSATSGDWTVDGVVEVEDIKVSNHRLTIRAKRKYIGWLRDASFSGEKATKLRVEAELSAADKTADNLDRLFSRIFLTPEDHFAELVPDYWKPCVLAGLGGTPSKQYTRCHFSREFLAIPGVGSPPEQRRPEKRADPDAGAEILHAGKGGVTPPKIRLNTFPQFSPEARQAKYQGTVTLLFVVDKTGAVRNIRIMSPLGFGLDRNAVETVAKWQFDPARKDGEPVDVEIAAETDFHLY